MDGRTTRHGTTLEFQNRIHAIAGGRPVPAVCLRQGVFGASKSHNYTRSRCRGDGGDRVDTVRTVLRFESVEGVGWCWGCEVPGTSYRR